jgi:hypothetical protein
VHLVFQLVFGLARLHMANRLVGSTWRQDLTAMYPAVVSAVGVVALALPVRLLLPETWWSLVAMVVCGVAGSLLALLLMARPALARRRDAAAQERGLTADRSG